MKEEGKKTSISSLKNSWGAGAPPQLELLAVVIVLFTSILHETLTNINLDTNTICQLSHGNSFKCRKFKSISQQKCSVDCITDWHNILNEDVHVTLCLEQGYAGYFGAKTTLDRNPSDIGAFDCSCIWGRVSQELI